MKRTSIIAASNQKGGVGKTTSVINLASSYAAMGKKVLIIDSDYQANATVGLGIEQSETKEQKNLHTAFASELSLDQVVIPTAFENLDIVAGSEKLAQFELSVSGTPRQSVLFENLLNSKKTSEYDIVFIDIHPNLGAFFQSIMKAAHYYYIPLFPEKFSAIGLQKQFIATEEVRKYLNRMLTCLGGLITQFDKSRDSHIHAVEVIEKISTEAKFGLIQTRIPYSKVVSDAQAYNLPLNRYQYSKGQPVAHAYSAVAAELATKLKGQRTGAAFKPVEIDKIRDTNPNQASKIKRGRRINREQQQ